MRWSTIAWDWPTSFATLAYHRSDGVQEDMVGGRRTGGLRLKLRCQATRGSPNSI